MREAAMKKSVPRFLFLTPTDLNSYGFGEGQADEYCRPAYERCQNGG